MWIAKWARKRAESFAHINTLSSYSFSFLKRKKIENKKMI
jgi:hypothetical protein